MDETRARTRLLRVLRRLERERCEPATDTGAVSPLPLLPGECCLEAEGTLRGFEGAAAMVHCDLGQRTPASAAEPSVPQGEESPTRVSDDEVGTPRDAGSSPVPRITPRLRSARRGH